MRKTVPSLVAASALLVSVFVSRASQLGGGSGQSTICVGYLPRPCAIQGQVVRAPIDIGAPLLGSVFIEPDYGERMVRVSDTSIPPIGTGTNQTFAVGFFDNLDASSPGTPQCPIYRYTVGNRGSNLMMAYLKSCDMTITQIYSTNYKIGTHPGWAPMASVSNFALDTVGTIIGQGDNGVLSPPDEIDAYSFPGSAGSYTGGTADHYQQLFQFTSTLCPNMPTFSRGNYAGHFFDTTNAAGHLVIMHDYGEDAQDGGEHFVFVVTNTGTPSSPNWTCQWWDTEHDQTGGSIGATQTVGLNLPAPTSVTASAVSDGLGSFTVGTHQVQTSFVGFNNASYPAYSDVPETLPSAQLGVVTGSTDSISVTRPVPGTDANTRVYLGWSPPNLHNRPYAWCVYIDSQRTTAQSACYAWNSFSSVTIHTPPSSGSPLATSRAGYPLHGSELAIAGNYIKATPTSSAVRQSLLFYKIGTATGFGCTADAGDTSTTPGLCDGHAGSGTLNFANSDSNNAGAGTAGLATLIRPYAGNFYCPETSPYPCTQLVPNAMSPAYAQDSHYQWVPGATDQNPMGIIPYIGPNQTGVVQSDGTQNMTNPVINFSRAAVNSVNFLSTDGKQTIWSIAHLHGVPLYSNLAGGQPSESTSNFGQLTYGSLSPDGHWYQFATNDDWKLGVQNTRAWPGPGQLNTSSYFWPNVNGGTDPSGAGYIFAASGTPYLLLGPQGCTTAASQPAGLGTVTTMGATVQDGSGGTPCFSEVIPTCPATTPFVGWAANQNVITNYMTQDTNNNIEVAQGGFTTGSGSHPAWCTTPDQCTTSDNGGTWEMYQLGNSSAGWVRDPPALGCRTDVFIVEVR